MSEDQAGSGSRPGPIQDRKELKKPTLVDQEIQGNDDINNGNVTAAITDIQSIPARSERKNWVFYTRDGRILPYDPRVPQQCDFWDYEDDNWCSGYDDIFNDECCSFCGRGHTIERCRRYRRQRKLDAQSQARSSSTSLSSKD